MMDPDGQADGMERKELIVIFYRKGCFPFHLDEF